MHGKMIFLACLAATLVSPSFSQFQPSQPIPFHLAQFPSFHNSRGGENPAAPSGFFLPPPPSDGERRPGLVPATTVQRPPPPLAPLPWEIPERASSDSFAQREHFPSFFVPRPQEPTSPTPPEVKPVKGGKAYPKKWIPTSSEGKKIKPKNVEKHTKQLVVLSSMTNKELRDDEVQVEPQPRVDVLKIHRKPKNKRQQVSTPYEPLPVEARYPQQAPPTAALPLHGVEEEPGFIEEPKPYAHNHRQEASGTGFTPLFAAEAAGSQHGFVGHESAHPLTHGSGDRVAFHIHGEKGPKSYRFGYDTGKGPDRQFRYEQRDDDGNVKGHFGFYDKHGKLQVVHYSADPKNGFSADGGNFGKHEIL